MKKTTETETVEYVKSDKKAVRKEKSDKKRKKRISREELYEKRWN